MTVTFSSPYVEASKKGRIAVLTLNRPEKRNAVCDALIEDVNRFVLSSTAALFASSDEVLRAWEILTPVQHAWEMDSKPLEIYQKGSSPREILS